MSKARIGKTVVNLTETILERNDFLKIVCRESLKAIVSCTKHVFNTHFFVYARIRLVTKVVFKAIF